MDRPLLEDQIAASKMSRDELVEALMPHSVVEKIDFWVFRHANFVWSLLHWNWFDVYKKEEK